MPAEGGEYDAVFPGGRIPARVIPADNHKLEKGFTLSVTKEIVETGDKIRSARAHGIKQDITELRRLAGEQRASNEAGNNVQSVFLLPLLCSDPAPPRLPSQNLNQAFVTHKLGVPWDTVRVRVRTSQSISASRCRESAAPFGLATFPRRRC